MTEALAEPCEIEAAPVNEATPPASSEAAVWSLLPQDLLQQVASHMTSPADVAAARRVSCHWRDGITWGISSLRPRIIPAAGQLDKFLNLTDLDLRRTSISPVQLQQLEALGSCVKHLQLMYLERMGRPHEYFEQLEELYAGLQRLSARFWIELELSVDEAPYARSFMLADADLSRIVAVPRQLALTSLHLSHQLGASVGEAGVLALTKLSHLRSLDLVSYAAKLNNTSFREFSRLTALERLHIGLVKHVTGDGLAEGLAPCRKLTDLTLVDCSSLQNRGLGQLAAAVPQLQSLTLIKCPWLTDSAVQHLQKLVGLSKLSLADNSNLTYEKGLYRLQSLLKLQQVEIRRLTHIGPDEVEMLLAFDSVEQVNDRCKLVRNRQLPELMRPAAFDGPQYALCAG